MLRKLTSFFLVIIVGCPAFFFSTMIFITMVSPSLSGERLVEIFVAILSFITAGACYWYFVWPVVSSGDDKSGPHFGVPELRKPSARCRLMSAIVLLFMVSLVLLGLAAPLVTPTPAPSEDVGSSIAVIFLLAVFVRALASIYRYNLRLSSFYDARADYLCLAGDDVKKLGHEKRLELVGTDELDTTSIREFWYSLVGRSPSQNNREHPHNGNN